MMRRILALAEVMPDWESREKPAAAAVTEPDPEETEPVSRRPEKRQGERRPARTWVSREDLLTEDDVMEEGHDVYRVITLDDGTQAASIALYDGREKNVEIPAELGGYPVAALEGEAFSDNEYIQSVTVPDVHLQENTSSQTGGVLTVTVNPDLYAGMQLVVTADAGTVWEMSAVWDDECVGQICV